MIYIQVVSLAALVAITRDVRAIGQFYAIAPGLCWVFIAMFLQQAQAGMFRNIGFDEANTNNIELVDSPYGPKGSGPASDLLPGWELTCGSNSVVSLDINVVPVGGPHLSLFGTGAPFGNFVEGSYSLALSDPSGPCFLTQRADVPADTRILNFKYLGHPMSLELNGQAVPAMVPLLADGASPRRPSFNISAFRGREVVLRMVQFAADAEPVMGRLISAIDSLEFRGASKTDFWFQRETGGLDTILFRSAGTNGSLVAVGEGGTILWSANGQRWIQQTSPTTNDLYGVAFGNGTWVAVGYRGTILSSPDGQDWALQFADSDSSITNAPSLSAVIYAQGIFVAVGGQGPYPNRCARVWTSPDGVTWTDRSPAQLGLFCATALNDVIYTPEKQAFVAVGLSTVVVSNDGIVWYPLQGGRNIPLARSVVFGKGQFVTAADNGVFTSPDALNWTQVDVDTGLLRFSLNAAAYFDETFWVAGAYWDENPVATILRSTDAKVWWQVDGLNLPRSSFIRDLSIIGDSLLAVGEPRIILQSGSVAAPPQFRDWETRFQTNGSVALALDAAPGSTVSIEYSDDLRTWSPLRVVTNSATRVEIEDPGHGSANRFYRAGNN